MKETDEYEYDEVVNRYDDYALNEVTSRDGDHIIELCREVFEKFALKTIDGVLVDVQTANAIILVYDALNDENKKKYAAINNISRMGRIAWQCVK